MTAYKYFLVVVAAMSMGMLDATPLIRPVGAHCLIVWTCAVSKKIFITLLLVLESLRTVTDSYRFSY